MNADVREVLVRARAEVEREWCKWPEIYDGGTCAYLAIVDNGTDEDATVREDAVDVFAAAIGTRDITLWNDAPERTQAEVLAAFDKAIALCEQEL